MKKIHVSASLMTGVFGNVLLTKNVDILEDVDSDTLIIFSQNTDIDILEIETYNSNTAFEFISKKDDPIIIFTLNEFLGAKLKTKFFFPDSDILFYHFKGELSVEQYSLFKKAIPKLISDGWINKEVNKDFLTNIGL